MEDSRITIRDVAVKNSGDASVISHWINKNFDFAHKLHMPEKIVLENIKINEPYRLSFYADLPENLSYKEVYVRNCGSFGKFAILAESVVFSDWFRCV